MLIDTGNGSSFNDPVTRVIHTGSAVVNLSFQVTGQTVLLHQDCCNGLTMMPGGLLTRLDPSISRIDSVSHAARVKLHAVNGTVVNQRPNCRRHPMSTSRLIWFRVPGKGTRNSELCPGLRREQ